MKYKMYDEMMEQPESLRKTFESEMPKGWLWKFYLNLLQC